MLRAAQPKKMRGLFLRSWSGIFPFFAAGHSRRHFRVYRSFSCSVSPWYWPFVNFRRARLEKENPHKNRKRWRIFLVFHLSGRIARTQKKSQNADRAVLSLSLSHHCLASLDGRTSTPGGRSPYTHMRIKPFKKRKKEKERKKLKT